MSDPALPAARAVAPPAIRNPPASLRRPALLIDALTLAAFAVLVALLCRALVPALVDDSFIYLRIAANIGRGHGWLYNAGEVSNAATSPLYTLLLTAVGALGGYDAAGLAACYGLTLYALIALQYLAWRRSDGWLFAATIALGAGLGVRLLDSFGMESALLVALVSATALAWRRRGDSWITGLLAGLTALARPEGIALLGLIGLIELVQHRRIAWRSVSGTLVIVLPWLLFSALYFGSVMSQTAEVKAAQRHLGWWATQPDFIFDFLAQARWPWLTLPLAAGGALLACRRLRMGDAFAALCIGFGVLQVAGYQVLGAPSGYGWYFVPGNFAVDLGVLLLGCTLLRGLAAHLRARFARMTLRMLGSALLLALIARIGMAPWFLPGTYGLSAEYRVAAAWLHDHGTPGDTVAATEIGYIGWYSGLRVLDIHGLLHPEALAALRAHDLHWWYDRGERPRYVVEHTPAWHGEPDSRETWPVSLTAEFAREYHLAYRYGQMRVYQRNAPSG